MYTNLDGIKAEPVSTWSDFIMTNLLRRVWLVLSDERLKGNSSQLICWLEDRAFYLYKAVQLSKPDCG